MGKSNRQGIFAREASIRIIFNYEGKRHFETLSIPPTPSNLKYAASVRTEILRRIEIGTFNFAEFFPDSKNAPIADRPLARNIVNAWLETKGRSIEATTLKEYRNAANAYFVEPFGNRFMDSITFIEISKLMSDLQVSNKTYNNILSVLRGIYDYAIKAGAAKENLPAKIDFAKKDEPVPDPLKPHEIEKILRDMSEHYHEQIVNYFDLAVSIGFRPSEGIDLRWSNVDWEEGTLKINSAKVRRVSKPTKTNKGRIVELDDYCINILKRQKVHTFMAGDHIFTYPVTGRPHPDTSNLVEKYWRPALKRCGIRDRDARQTRHTCASMMLTAGCKPAWAAVQLGHSIEMFYRVYAEWIPGANKGEERNKLSALRAQGVPTLCQSK